MKKKIISSSVIGTILTGNVVKANIDVTVSKVIYLSKPNTEYILPDAQKIDFASLKGEDRVISLLAMKCQDGQKLSEKLKSTSGFFISAFKTAGADITEYKDDSVFTDGTSCEIYVDVKKPVTNTNVKINNTSPTGSVVNFNSYKVHQFLNLEGKDEKKLLEILKTSDTTNFKDIDDGTYFIESYKIGEEEVKCDKQEFNKGKEILSAILANDKVVEIIAKKLKDKINITIENEAKLDANKFTDKKLDNIKNYLKYLSNGRHSDNNPVKFQNLIDVIKGIDTKVTSFEIKEGNNVVSDLTQGIDCKKSYTIKFPEGFYKATHDPAADTTDITVKFVAKEGFELKGLQAQQTFKVPNSKLTVEELINAINTKIDGLGLKIGDTSFIITIDGVTGAITSNTAVEKGKTVTISINKDGSKYIEKKEDPKPGEQQNQQQQDQKDTNKKGKGCCGSNGK